jgi:hypothetical protein
MSPPSIGLVGQILLAACFGSWTDPPLSALMKKSWPRPSARALAMSAPSPCNSSVYSLPVSCRLLVRVWSLLLYGGCGALEQQCLLRRSPITRRVSAQSVGNAMLLVSITRPRGWAQRPDCRPRLEPCRRHARWALAMRSPRRSRVRCWRRAVLVGGQM